MSKEKNYVSYFQSVITIGIMSKGIDNRDAGNKAKEKLLDKKGINHCFFDQTDFDITSIEEWKPEIDSIAELEGVSFKFNPDEETKNVIATRLHKSADDITEEDYHRFVKEAIQKELKP